MLTVSYSLMLFWLLVFLMNAAHSTNDADSLTALKLAHLLVKAFGVM